MKGEVTGWYGVASIWAVLYKTRPGDPGRYLTGRCGCARAWLQRRKNVYGGRDMKEWNFDAVIIGGGVTGCA
ncbi:MAG: hypothetical protein HFG59_13225, partial [Lachnospiraceae bacterium]|nr:hypothetical protein [Lachnospiraceae bacterium]